MCFGVILIPVSSTAVVTQSRSEKFATNLVLRFGQTSRKREKRAFGRVQRRLDPRSTGQRKPKAICHILSTMGAGPSLEAPYLDLLDLSYYEPNEAGR